MNTVVAMNRNLLGLAAAMVATALLAGCGGSGRPATAPTSGTLTMAGEPLANADIAFWGEGASTAGAGRTDAAGKFTISTFGDGDGAIVGEQVAIVTLQDDSTVVMPSVSADGNSDADYEKMSKGAEAYMQTSSKPYESPIPQKYSNRVTSPFKVTVTEEGPNVFEFNIEK